ncbi:YfdX family protein, partial [Salmonella enterica subsp. enterica serovar Braenderup]
TNIPLASYPAAVKAVVPLIDQGKIEEAKAALQSALNTLVEERSVLPLPVLRAKLLLKRAEPTRLQLISYAGVCLKKKGGGG